MKRHKWDGKFISRCVDGGIAKCVKCGMLKQYEKGRPFYFINDTVYFSAPPCDPPTSSPSKS